MATKDAIECICLTLAIVFTDIVGSTALNVELGDAAMSEVRRRHFAQSTALLAKHAGYEVKTNGRHKAGSIRDGVLLDVVGDGQGCG
jgi:class 3 adenylate cyclase